MERLFFRFLACVALSSFGVISSGQSIQLHRFSQVRDSETSYKVYFHQNRGGTSVQDEAVTPDKLDLKKFTTTYSSEDALAAFQKGRDFRFLKWADQPNFPRRSSWLFPDDGCWARAALLSQNLATWNYQRPIKVFVFGNLTVKTNNSPDGQVSWWYHVVDGATVEGQPVVFDPAIDPTKPMALNDWLLKMVPALDQIQVSVCHSETYQPDSDCETPDLTEEKLAVDDQTGFLTPEWDRVTQLGRNPNKELGDNPPWLPQILGFFQ